MPGEGGYPASAERDFRATGRKRGEVPLSERPLRVAVIGSGPAGMYAAVKVQWMTSPVKVPPASGKPLQLIWGASPPVV